MSEDPVIKARKQLLIVGVICVAVVVFTIWLMSLPRTLARNRAQYSSATPIKDFFQRELTRFRK